jgi:uncharacterized damage-inducible protein DinB
MKSGNDKTLSRIVGRALSGEGAHAGTEDAFDGVDWKAAAVRPPGVPHSIFQLLLHMSYWQNWVLQWLDGKSPTVPKHAGGSWSANPSPANSEQWKRAVRDFCDGLESLEARSREEDLLGKIGQTSRLQMLHTIASHTSYHVGQVVVLRQVLGKWPPPSGGLTW